MDRIQTGAFVSAVNFEEQVMRIGANIVLRKKNGEWERRARLSKVISCFLPKCVGVQWALVAIVFLGFGAYLALVWYTST